METPKDEALQKHEQFRGAGGGDEGGLLVVAGDVPHSEVNIRQRPGVAESV